MLISACRRTGPPMARAEAKDHILQSLDSQRVLMRGRTRNNFSPPPQRPYTTRCNAASVLTYHSDNNPQIAKSMNILFKTDIAQWLSAKISTLATQWPSNL